MKTAHTPGPWIYIRSPEKHDGEYDFAINGPGHPILAEVYGRSCKGGYPPAEANAALIAAAPELFAALEYLLVNISERDHDLDPHYIEKARDAIAKAEGSKP